MVRKLALEATSKVTGKMVGVDETGNDEANEADYDCAKQRRDEGLRGNGWP